MTMNTEFIDRYGMLPPGTRVLVALSGGKDSVYLLHRLLELAQPRDLIIGAAHFNHMLRGAESQRDTEFVAELCRKLGVPLFEQRGMVKEYALEHRKGIEEASRELRYAFLEGVRADQGYHVIATAHHANDQAETMLLNLARGAGTKGLAGIPPVRGNIIRPILNIPDAEIKRYLSEREIRHVEDSSNQDDGYRRNRIRHQVIPVLEELNPRFASHAAVAALSLREDDEFLETMAREFLEAHYQEDGVLAAELSALPKPVAVRALRLLCGSALSRQQTESILWMCTQTQRRSLNIYGTEVRYDQGRLIFGPLPKQAISQVRCTGERGTCTAGAYHISWEIGRYSGEIHNSFNTFCLKREKIKGTVRIAEKRDGDRIRLAGRNCTKTLKALFQERKLTQYQRKMLPVVRDDAGVLAIPGFGMDERCLPEIGDEVMRISCEE